MSDERVDHVGNAIDSHQFSPSSGGVCSCGFRCSFFIWERHRAEAAIAALEAAGYTVARLEQSKQYELIDDVRSSVPLYRIVKEPVGE